MGDGDSDGDERAAKRARVDAAPLDDVMAATREQLTRTADPHLQAKLLIQYSAQAVAPAAPTEAAIEFLFAFLQQSQSTAHNDQTKSPPGPDTASTVSNSSSNSGGNPVVVAAVVRGLRGLLAVKPQLVEPMIQLDGMAEQLTQCISLPEDFKLRRDMLRIVLDCFVPARKFRETEHVLRACLGDHDDGLRGAALDGYERVLAAGHCLNDTAQQELVDRLREILLLGDEERTRTKAARLLGVVAEQSFQSASFVGPSLRDVIVTTLASAVRDPSPRVRLQVATSFRCFHGATAPETLYAHLFQKKQINEDLAEIDTQSTAMLTSGALLTLLEDDKMEVAMATSSSMRLLCDAGFWSFDLIDRAVATHMEMAARVGGHQEHVLEALRNLERFLERWHAIEKALYPVTREELCYLLGGLPTTSFAVVCGTLGALRFLVIDTPPTADCVVQFLIRCAQAKVTDVTNQAKGQSLRSSTLQLVGKWIEQSVLLPAETMASLRRVASGPSVNPVTAICQTIYNALSRPADRLVERQVQLPTIQPPRFLGGH